MSRRRGATALAGILPVDKPAGMTSHDVVTEIRRATGEGRVGHAGTLDPLATGLLTVLVGPYTRLEPYLSSSWKTYEARITFGCSTDTDDAEGEVMETAEVPDSVFDVAHARSVLDSFLGASMQKPPAFSAIKVGGVTAHRAARSGASLDLADRPIEVSSAELVAIDPPARSWDVVFRVSKGTYIRALARDIGRACGTVAMLSRLRRTEAGTLHVEQAHALDDVLSSAQEGHIASLFADPAAVLALPVVPERGTTVANGRSVPSPDARELPEGALISVLADGVFYGVYRRSGGLLTPETVVGSVQQ